MCAMSPRLLRPTASGFNPASISGIANWWDANDAATVTLNSGFVETWTSKAGRKSAASQSVSNNRPATTTVNGKTAVSFDGSNDGLDFTGTAAIDETWIIAAAQTADQSGTRALVNDGTDGQGITIAKGGNRFVDITFGAPSVEGVTRLRPAYAVNASTPYGPAVLSVVKSTAAGGFVFIDGTQRSSAIDGSPSFTTPGSRTMQRIGYYGPTLFQFQGWIGEILLYSRALSASERLKVERYLGKKWGITVA
jgi:hypothetical protein